jgi:hypothetical protein
LLRSILPKQYFEEALRLYLLRQASDLAVSYVLNPDRPLSRLTRRDSVSAGYISPKVAQAAGESWRLFSWGTIKYDTDG